MSLALLIVALDRRTSSDSSRGSARSRESNARVVQQSIESVPQPRSRSRHRHFTSYPIAPNEDLLIKLGTDVFLGRGSDLHNFLPMISDKTGKTTQRLQNENSLSDRKERLQITYASNFSKRWLKGVGSDHGLFVGRNIRAECSPGTDSH